MANISQVKLPDGTIYSVKDNISGYVATEATTSAKGLMSASDKTKLNGIASGAEVNQNAFSNVTVGTTTVAADSKTDTLTLEGGANITLTPDTTNDKITILLDDTVDTGEVIATDIQAGNLIVNGSARFLNTINGDISGSAATATSATKATQDESGNNIKSTYAASFSISDHTITLKNKNGTSLGTVTVPDNNTTYTVDTGTANGKIKVTPSTGNAYEVSVYGLKSAAYKDVTDTYSETGTDPVSGKAVKAAIDGLPSPMVFRGTVGAAAQNPTVTSLPVDGTAVVGDTYKVITNGTYGGKASKVGDTLICLTKTSSANTWEIVPSGDEPSGTVTSVAIANGGGLSVSGSPITSSGTITISHADTSSQASVNNSGRTYIQDITLDTYGHVTGITSATETVVNTDRYVNSAAFADATSADANNPVKMTLTRAGSDTASVTAYIPKVSSSSAGVVPKGATVSSQSQSTKFLREDGTWAAPSYTTNTNTTYTISASGESVVLTGSDSSTSTADLSSAFGAYLPLAGGQMTGTIITPKNDSMGIRPNTHNWGEVGDANYYFYKAYIANYYGTTSYITNWASNGNIGTSATSSAASTRGYVNFYNTCAAGGTQTKTTLYAHTDANANTNILLPKTAGTLVHDGEIPTVLGTKSFGVSTNDVDKKIKIKINPKNPWMLCFTVTLYQSYTATKVMISGYNYGSNHWYGQEARILSSTINTGINVYFGYDADYELWVGFDAGGYTGVTVDSVTNGYSQISNYRDMFTISLEDSLTTIQSTTVRYRPWHKNETVDNATYATSAGSATTASKLGSSNVGSATQPIYLSAGTATACTYTLGKSVPSDAVFTDTKNTAGSTDTSSKIYLIGATSQAANPQTYSDNEVFATSGVLTTKSIQVGGGSCTMQYNSTTQSLDFVFAS